MAEPVDFCKAELERYSRQILLYGIEAQKRLKRAKVAVLGAGGIGCAVLPYLVSSGVGNLLVVDDDVVDSSNLARQVLFQQNNIGQVKARLAADKMAALNPYIQIEARTEKLNASNIEDILKDSEFVLEGTDSIENKFLVSDYCSSENKVAFIGGLGTVQGHIFTLLPASHASDQSPPACYRCIFEGPPPAGSLPTCATAGILSPLPGVIGTMMAYLATKVLAEKAITRQFFLLENDGWRTIQLKKNPQCHFCN